MKKQFDQNPSFVEQQMNSRHYVNDVLIKCSQLHYKPLLAERNIRATSEMLSEIFISYHTARIFLFIFL